MATFPYSDQVEFYGDIHSLSAAYSHLQQENDDLKKRVQKLESQLTGKQHSIDFMKMQFKQLRETQSKPEPEPQPKLQEELEAKKKLLQEAEKALGTSVRQTTQLLEENKEYQQEVAALKVDMEFQNKEMSDLREENKLLQNQNTMLGQQIEEQEKTIQESLFAPQFTNKGSPNCPSSISKLYDQLRQLEELHKIVEERKEKPSGIPIPLSELRAKLQAK